MKKRIPSVDMLRGIAAFSVCIFHFSNGNSNYFSDGYWLKEVGSKGWAGVEIFFVISGFIIPYSLHGARYSLKNFKPFLLKRILRIEPPYFIAISLVLLLAYLSTLSPYFKGAPFHIDYLSLLLHIGYLNDFFNRPWLNSVFWTLAIEFQFYLLIGLVFPLINHKKLWIGLVTIALLSGCTLISQNSPTIFHYILYFLLGILIFKRKISSNSRNLIWVFEFILLFAIYLQFSLTAFIASLFAWVILSFFENWENKWILFVGKISYSLYLIHVPIGGKIINFSMNFFKTDFSRSFALLFAVFVTLFLSYLFYKFVEQPAVRFSHSFFTKNKKTLDAS